MPTRILGVLTIPPFQAHQSQDCASHSADPHAESGKAKEGMSFFKSNVSTHICMHAQSNADVDASSLDSRIFSDTE